MKFIKTWSFWVVGNGGKIQTWIDNWIPGTSTVPIPNVETAEAQNYAKVSDLIDTHSRTWKADTVRRLFSYEDAEKILQIRIPVNGADRLVWTLTRNTNLQLNQHTINWWILKQIVKQTTMKKLPNYTRKSGVLIHCHE